GGRGQPGGPAPRGGPRPAHPPRRDQRPLAAPLTARRGRPLPAHPENRQVIGGLHAPGDPGTFLADGVPTVGGPRPRPRLRQQRLEAFSSVERAPAGRRFGHAVRDETEHVAGLQPERARRVGKAIDRAERRTAAVREAPDEPLAARHEVRRLVTGVAVLEETPARVEGPCQHGDEESFGVLARDLGVGLAHYRLDLARLPQRRALVERLADGHEEAARHPLAGHVADQEENAVAVEREEVIEIAAYLTGWLEKRIEVEARVARKDRGRLRQAAHLDAAGRLQLTGDPGRLLALLLDRA